MGGGLFLIAANPIAINQCLTFYVDGLVASFSVVLAAASSGG
jgi:hypothetical protein